MDRVSRDLTYHGLPLADRPGSLVKAKEITGTEVVSILIEVLFGWLKSREDRKLLTTHKLENEHSAKKMWKKDR